jgi:F-type H+-transporting ATPase subunit gamma
VAGSGQIRQLRRRIRSVKSTQKITRAMEMIAASRILRAQRLAIEARPYAEQITEIIKGLAVSNEAKGHPLLAEHASANQVGVVVISADRGLAGAYNSNVLKRAEAVIAEEEQAGSSVRLFVVGRKAQGYFTFRGRKPERVWTGVSDAPTYAAAEEVGELVISRYGDLDLDRVWLVYTDFRSMLTQTPTAMKLLPVDPKEFEGGSELPPEFLFEPGPSEILSLLIPRYIEAKVFHAMLESSASEHASRQRAMKSATDNAEDVITYLSRVMNQARQDQITTEISEIVGGAEALAAG